MPPVSPKNSLQFYVELRAIYIISYNLYQSLACLLFSKHALQYTGLSSEGWKVIFASAPHSAQVTVKYSRGAL